MKVCKRGLHQYDDSLNRCPSCRETWWRASHAEYGSPEHYARVSAGRMGKTHSSESRANISAAALQRGPLSDEHRTKIVDLAKHPLDHRRIQMSEVFEKLSPAMQKFIKKSYRRRFADAQAARQIVTRRRS